MVITLKEKKVVLVWFVLFFFFKFVILSLTSRWKEIEISTIKQCHCLLCAADSDLFVLLVARVVFYSAFKHPKPNPKINVL